MPPTLHRNAGRAIPEIQSKVIVAERLSYLLSRVRVVTSQRHIWERFLSNGERQQIESSAKSYTDMVEVWAELHQLSYEHALVEVAKRCNFLFPGEEEVLVAHLGARVREQSVTPWLEDDGRLIFNGEVIRQLSIRANPSKVERLLRAFQEQNWARVIESPFVDELDPQFVHNAVRQANKQLQQIRFEVQGRGQQVSWQQRVVTA